MKKATTRKKATKKAARKRTAARKPAGSATAKKGPVNRWMPAKRVRVRRVAGKTLIDIEK